MQQNSTRGCKVRDYSCAITWEHPQTNSPTKELTEREVTEFNIDSKGTAQHNVKTLM